MKKIISLIFALIIFLLISNKSIKAESLTVSATINTGFILKGYTSPQSLVVFKKNDIVIGNTISDNNGFFEKKFNNQEPGIHNIYIYSTDPNNKNTDAVNQNIPLLLHQTLIIDNIYLSPSININKTIFNKDEKIKISGYTKPESLLEIKIEGKKGITKILSSDNKGYYYIEINTNDLDDGDYNLTSSIKDIFNLKSIKSEVLNFSILETTETTANKPTITSLNLNITPTSKPIVCPYFYKNLCFFDELKKGIIEEKEVFKFILGFIKYFSQPINNIFDINSDNVVDAVDLSIFLFHTKNINEKNQVLSASTKNIDNKNILSAITEPTFNFSINTVKENIFLNYLITLFMLEFIIGIPFFILFILLIFLSKKYVRKK